MSVHINPQNHYPYVGPTRNGKQEQSPIHVLVALAFHGPRPDGMEVRHLDGVRTNNRPENLSWGTHAENMQDAIAHGTFSRHKSDRTHCVHGHEYTDANTHITPPGSRRCRACDREWTAAARYRRRVEIAPARLARIQKAAA